MTGPVDRPAFSFLLQVNAMTELVRIERDGALAHVILDRPQALNALDLPMVAALRRALAAVRDDDGVRAVLLRANGNYFMAGGDVAFMRDALASDAATRRAGIRQLIQDAHAAIRAVVTMGKPVVAAVQGGAAGYGVSLVAACDFAVAADNSNWSMAYTNLGVTPDGGATWFLPRLVGLRRARELVLLSDRFSAQDALRLDLVNRLVPAEQVQAEALALAQRLATGPTFAYANAKKLLAASFEQSLDTHLEAEEASFFACSESADFAEGVAAFAGKRRPTFTGLRSSRPN